MRKYIRGEHEQENKKEISLEAMWKFLKQTGTTQKHNTCQQAQEQNGRKAAAWLSRWVQKNKRKKDWKHPLNAEKYPTMKNRKDCELW